MAVRQIQFPIVYKQNQNAESSGYGKYYPYAWKPDTLTLRGLIERVAMDQSVYSRDIVEGVIQRLTKVMVELLQAGQPVKWDGLGTFTPTVESVKGGYSEAQIKAGASVRDVIAGVHIRFIPENEKGEEITSRKFKDLVTFMVEGIALRVEVGQTATGKKKYATNIQSIEDFRSDNSAAGNGGSSSGSNGGNSGSQNGGTQSGGDNSGSQGQQNQQSGYALTIATSGSGTATVTHDGNTVTSGATLNEDDEVEISITPAEGQVPTASINSSSIELTEDNGVYTGSFAMPGQASALVISTGVSGDGGDGGEGLDKD